MGGRFTPPAGSSLFQQGLEFVPADSEEVPGARVEAGAEGGGHDGDPTTQRVPQTCRGVLGMEAGRDRPVTVCIKLITDRIKLIFRNDLRPEEWMTSDSNGDSSLF